MGVYNSLNDRKLSKETARAYIESTKLYKKSNIAFQTEIPAGTVMTIVSLLPKPWYRLFLSSRYIITLEPDLSQGLDVVIELDRGLEGSLDGLSPEIFSHEKTGLEK